MSILFSSLVHCHPPSSSQGHTLLSKSEMGFYVCAVWSVHRHGTSSLLFQNLFATKRKTVSAENLALVLKTVFLPEFPHVKIWSRLSKFNRIMHRFSILLPHNTVHWNTAQNKEKESKPQNKRATPKWVLKSCDNRYGGVCGRNIIQDMASC